MLNSLLLKPMWTLFSHNFTDRASDIVDHVVCSLQYSTWAKVLEYFPRLVYVVLEKTGRQIKYVWISFRGRGYELEFLKEPYYTTRCERDQPLQAVSKVSHD